jgi:hypothetical protein
MAVTGAPATATATVTALFLTQPAAAQPQCDVADDDAQRDPRRRLDGGLGRAGHRLTVRVTASGACRHRATRPASATGSAGAGASRRTPRTSR